MPDVGVFATRSVADATQLCAVNVCSIWAFALKAMRLLNILLLTMHPFYERLKKAIGTESAEDLAARTAMSVAEVQRFLAGAPLDAGFLASVCRQYGVNSEWLIHGTGPMRQADVKRFAVLQARASTCLGSIAAEADRLTERLDLVERLLNTLDARLRVAMKGETDIRGAAASDARQD